MPRGAGAHHDERRAEIADAVLEVVAGTGLGAVSLGSVARSAGVSPGRVQHYFPTRAAMLEGAFDRATERNSARIAAALGGRWEDAPPPRALEAVLVELVPTTRAERAQLRVRHAFNAQALADPAVAARVSAMYAALFDSLADLLVAGSDDATRPDVGRARATARDLVALAEGLSYHVVLGVADAPSARAAVRAAVAAACREKI